MDIHENSMNLVLPEILFPQFLFVFHPLVDHAQTILCLVYIIMHSPLLAAEAGYVPRIYLEYYRYVSLFS